MAFGVAVIDSKVTYLSFDLCRLRRTTDEAKTFLFLEHPVVVSSDHPVLLNGILFSVANRLCAGFAVSR